MSTKGMKLGYDFVPFPRQIWDEGLDLSAGEFKLLGWLLRYTISFGEKLTVSDDEILNGIKNRTGDRRVVKGVGMSRNSMKDARKRLEDRGWVKVVRNEQDSTKCTYSMNLVSEIDTLRDQVSEVDTSGVNSCHSDCQKLTLNKEEEDFQKTSRKTSTGDGLGLFSPKEIISSPEKQQSEAEKVIEEELRKAFDSYVHLFNRDPKRYILTENRLALAKERMAERLKEHGGITPAINDLLYAMNRCAESDFHNARGEFAGQKTYNDWENIFRSEPFYKFLGREPKVAVMPKKTPVSNLASDELLAQGIRRL